MNAIESHAYKRIYYIYKHTHTQTKTQQNKHWYTAIRSAINKNKTKTSEENDDKKSPLQNSERKKNRRFAIHIFLQQKSKYELNCGEKSERQKKQMHLKRNKNEIQ